MAAFKPLHDQRGLADIARALRQAASPAAAAQPAAAPAQPAAATAQPAAVPERKRRRKQPAEPLLAEPSLAEPPAEPAAELQAEPLLAEQPPDAAARTFRDYYVARFMDGFADDLESMQKEGQPLDVRLLVESIRARAQ